MMVRIKAYRYLMVKLFGYRSFFNAKNWPHVTYMIFRATGQNKSLFDHVLEDGYVEEFV